MSVSSSRTSTIQFTGDITGTEVLSALVNNLSPGQVQLVALASGFNSITVPAAGSVPSCLILIPAAGNATQLTLKGVTGDTGIALNLTDFASIPIAPSVTSIGITAAAACNVRIIWC